MKAHRKIGDIEVLRAIAVSMVVISHMKTLVYNPGSISDFILKWMDLGAGVDLFFVISGFVITLDLMRSYSDTEDVSDRVRISLAFWVRRAFRIFPSAWIWLAAFLCVAKYTIGTGSFDNNLRDAIAAIGQFANIHWYNCYRGAAPCGVNPIYWSLSLEEQFYLALPIVFIVARRQLPIVAILAVGAQIFLPRAMWSLPWAIRTDGLFLGVLLALCKHHPAYAALCPNWMRRPASKLLVLAVIVAISMNGWRLTQAWPGLLTVLCGLLVWTASYDQDFIARNEFIRKVGHWIGGRSFGIYLIHFTCMIFVNYIFFRVVDGSRLASGQLNAVAIASAVALTAGLADLNFRFVELPLRRVGTKLSRQIQRRETELAPASTDIDVNAITR